MIEASEAVPGRVGYGAVFHPTIPARYQISGYMPCAPKTGVLQLVFVDPIAMRDMSDDDRVTFLVAAVDAAGATLADPLVFIDSAYIHSASEVQH